MMRLLACVFMLCLASSYAAGFTVPPDRLPGQPSDSSQSVSAVPLKSILNFPDSVVFGEVGVGYCKDTIFILKATQPIRLPIQFSITGDTARAFSVIVDTTFAGTDTLRFTVRCCPRVDFVHRGTLVVMGDEDSITIPLAATAIQTVLPFNGRTVFDVGTIYIDSTQYDTTSIGRGDLELFQIDSISFRNQPAPQIFEVIEPLGTVVLLPQSDSTRIIVSTTGRELGRHFHKMTISTTKGWRDVEFQVNVGAKASPIVEITPREVNFGGVPVGSCIERTVTIRNLGEIPFIPEHRQLSGGGAFTLSAGQIRLLNQGDSTVLTYRFCPDSALVYNGADSVLLGFNGSSSTVTIPLSGYGFVGYWENIPREVNFGDVPLDSCRDTTLVFPNIIAVNLASALFERAANSNNIFRVVSPQSGLIKSGDSLKIHIQFCPSGIDEVTDILLIDSLQQQRLLSLPVRGRGVVGVLEFQASVDFGPVAVGDCDEREVIITNTGAGVASLDWFTGEIRPPFRLLNRPPSPHVLLPNESVTISIEFCPDSVGSFPAAWTGASRVGTQLQLTMTGQGIIREGRGIGLDTTTANVGEPARLVLRTVEPFRAAEGILFDSALVIFNYRSIVPQQVIGMAAPGAGGELVWEHVRDSIFRIRRVRGTAPIDGTDLFALEFIGLSSGQPENRVLIEGIWFSRNIAPRVNANGQVNLIGCDIGRTGTFTKRVAIRAIQSDLRSSAVDIAYNAPQGSMPMLGLVNLEGRRIFTRELPRGTGEEQSLHMSLEDVPAGLYLLELRVEDDLTTARIMVRE